MNSVLKIAALGAVATMAAAAFAPANAQSHFVTVPGGTYVQGPSGTYWNEQTARYVNTYHPGYVNAYPGYVSGYTQAQNRLCLRFDNRSLIQTDDDAEDAYDRAAALGNRCFGNYPRLNQSVTILPYPKGDTLNDADFYFLTREQRKAFGIVDR